MTGWPRWIGNVLLLLWLGSASAQAPHSVYLEELTTAELGRAGAELFVDKTVAAIRAALVSAR